MNKNEHKYSINITIQICEWINLSILFLYTVNQKFCWLIVNIIRYVWDYLLGGEIYGDSKKELVVNTNHLVGYQCYLPCFIPYWT